MLPILTDRLILRNWQPEDLEPFAVINQDPRVMEFYPTTLTFQETADLIEKFKAHIEQHGFGFYACVLQETNQFIGYCGLNIPTFTAPFTPCVEIGWRLGFQYWGKGYATEAANKALEIGFKKYNLKEIVAFTVPQNIRSRRVMEKIGMQRDKNADFHHPRIPINHPLSLHVLYRSKSYSTQAPFAVMDPGISANVSS